MHTPNGTLTKHTSWGGDRADIKFYVDDPRQLRDIMTIPYAAPKTDIGKLRHEREEFGDNGLIQVNIPTGV